MRIPFLFAIISVGLWAPLVVARRSASPSAPAMKLSTSEQAVWDQEQNYWRLLKADNRQGYLDFWDDRFVGWPRFENQPIHKDKITNFMSDIRVLDYKIEPLAVAEFGADIVITLYRATVRSADRTRGNESTSTSRLTHTWMWTEKGWHIIGGMSADDQTGLFWQKQHPRTEDHVSVVLPERKPFYSDRRKTCQGFKSSTAFPVSKSTGTEM